MFKKPSILAWIVCCIALILYQGIGNIRDTLTWDAFGYYLYLPIKFIQSPSGIDYGEWLKAIFEKYQPSSTMYQVYQSETGYWMIRYTMGVALLEMPFFFIAHLLSLLLGYPQDGLSLPYQVCIAYGMLFYTFFGLYLVRKILLEYFNENTAALTLLVLVFGTNYLQLASKGAVLTHGIAFTTVAFVIWLTIKWHKKPHIKFAAAIGFLIGLATLIRPSEIVIALIPVCWNIYDRESFQNKIKLLKENYVHVFAAIIAALIVVLPQLIYWHNKTGHWFFNSYNNPGEGLDLYKPHIYNILLSFRKGWFIYTPVILFSMAGFYFLYQRRKDVFFPLLIYFLISLWVISSWTIWWYAGGSYSPRALLPVYAALSVPLSFTINSLIGKRTKITLIFRAVLILLIAHNFFRMWQWEAKIISREHMTYKYFKRTFFKTSVSNEDLKLLLPDRNNTEFIPDREYLSKRLVSHNFEQSPNDTSITAFEGKGVFRMDSINEFSPGLDMAYKDFMTKSYAWIITSVKCFVNDSTKSLLVLVAVFEHNGRSYAYHAKEAKAEKLKPGWNEIKLEMMTPEVRSENDKLKIYVWNLHHTVNYIDDFKIDLYDPVDD
jgi:hypothetical protein